MIDWLVQSVAAHPDLARGVAPSGLLSEPEQALLASLKTAKRRRDWLLGRWTAKHLLQTSIEQQTGRRMPLDALIVGSDPDGAPRVVADWRFHIADSQSANQSRVSDLRSLNLSISHSHGRAFCALALGMRLQLGADLERIEPRDCQFMADYFTADEIAAVRRAPAAERDKLVTAIWSAKEAALKALRLGLTVDTRSVSCTIGISEQADGWAAVDIVCDRRRLGMPIAPALRGWWRLIDDFVLTLVAMRSGEGSK
jgi:4'-phosphopantetheinyl transferase